MTEEERRKKEKRVAILEEKKIIRQAIDNKEDWGREEEIKEDHRKIEEMVPKKFLKQKKVFGKVELERIPMRKVWDHTIDLKEMFKLHVKYRAKWDRMAQSGVELLWNRWDLTTKQEQPWPQLMRCVSICCHVYGCVFQKD